MTSQTDKGYSFGGSSCHHGLRYACILCDKEKQDKEDASSQTDEKGRPMTYWGGKTDERCKCSFAIRMTGEGCRYCQPQNYIDHLIDQYEETGNELDAAEFKIDRLKRQVEVLREGLEVISRNVISPNTQYNSINYQYAKPTLGALKAKEALAAADKINQPKE